MYWTLELASYLEDAPWPASKDELIDLFDLDAVQKSAASFSPDKCDWLNQQHIMASSSDDLTPLLKGQLEQLGIDADDLSKGPDLESVAILQQSRCKTIAEMAEQSAWFYQSFPAYQDEIVQGAFTVDALPHLDALITSFERLTDWSSPPIHEAMKEVVSAAEVGFSKVGKPLRTAVTGGIPAGNLPDLLAVLGKSTVMDRIGKAIDWINAR